MTVGTDVHGFINPGLTNQVAEPKEQWFGPIIEIFCNFLEFSGTFCKCMSQNYKHLFLEFASRKTPGNDLMNFLVVLTDQDGHSKRIELSCRQYHVL